MGMPGHQEIELALMKLYEETGKESYKELAKYFIDVRGCGNRNYFLEEMEQKDVKRIFRSLTTIVRNIHSLTFRCANSARRKDMQCGQFICMRQWQILQRNMMMKSCLARVRRYGIIWCIDGCM